MGLKHTIIIIFILLLIGCGGSSDISNTDMSHDEIDPTLYNTEYPNRMIINNIKDANKTGNDNNLCWAAVASNMIANYEESKNSGNSNENYYFNKLKAVFDNKGDQVSTGLQYFNYDHLILTELDPNNFLKFIQFSINNGRAVALRLKLEGERVGHVINVFGYEIKENRSIELYTVESGDSSFRLNVLRYDSIDSFNYCGYKIDYCLSLIKDII